MQSLMDSITWLNTDSDSLASAIIKLGRMSVYIGFPPNIENGELVDKYYENFEYFNDSFTWLSMVNIYINWKMNQTVEYFHNRTYSIIFPWPDLFSDTELHSKWLTTVNAFYYAGPQYPGNWYTIPVTIAQHPLYDINYPSAVNFGGLGSVVGHEMTHAFDDNGRMYDWNGSYFDGIFSDITVLAYNSTVVTCFEKQYGEIKIGVDDDGNVIFDDGQSTLNENIADSGGIRSSWDAWVLYLDTLEEEEYFLPGVNLTHAQLFFWSYARVWCEVARPGVYSNWTNIHSPGYARVIGPLQNMQTFANAFDCETSTVMNPDPWKCKIW